VLLNAAYLKASWESPFPTQYTADGSFRLTPQSAVTVPMMNKVMVMRHAAGSNFQAVELPYVGGDLKMVIVLPAEGQLRAVRNSMDDGWFRTVAFENGGGRPELAQVSYQLGNRGIQGDPGSDGDAARIRRESGGLLQHHH